MPSVTIASGISLLGAATFTTCPAPSAPIRPFIVSRYYDVFLNPHGDWSANDTATVQFYNSDLTSFAQVFYWDATLGYWYRCSNQVVNVSGGCVIVTISTTTSPALASVTGSYFTLLDGSMDGDSDLPVIPPAAAMNVSVDVTFSWDAIAGAVGYDFQISEDATFDTAFSTTIATNSYKPDAPLKYDTQYWWKVTWYNAAGVRGFPIESTFKTAAVPAEITPTTTTQTTITVTVTYPPATPITITLPPETGWFSYLSWIVIAVIVLMVVVTVVLIVMLTRPRRTG
jgi:hypothetical protein